MSNGQKILGSRLKRALEKSPLSATELADKLKVTRGNVSHWTTGRRDCPQEYLPRLAALLKVDSGWLCGLEERVGSDMDAGWHFREAPQDGGRDYGNANVFATPPEVRTLVREQGQNSLDASLGVGPIHLRYTVIELNEGSNDYQAFLEAIRWTQLREHIARAADTDTRLGTRLRAGLERLDSQGKLTLLRLDDYGTTGLFGTDATEGSADRSPFAALVRNNLDSTKLSTKAGGSFGLGKAVIWRCSELSTVLFASDIAGKYRKGQREGVRVAGKTELTWHETDSSTYAGPGWLGGPEGRSLWVPKDALTTLQLDRFKLPDLLRDRGATGTSILIVGFRDPQAEQRSSTTELLKSIAAAASENFWLLMARGRLHVTVESVVDGKQEESFSVDQTDHVLELCDALNAHDEDEVLDQPLDVGDVARISIPHNVPSSRPGAKGIVDYSDDLEAKSLLIVRISENDPADAAHLNSIALVRGRGMVVQYWPRANIVVGARPFHAILLAGEAAGSDHAQQAAEQFLRLSEPPAHDKWEFNDEIREKFKLGAGTRLRELLDRTTDALRNAIKPRATSEEEGPDELRRLLQLGLAPPDSAPLATLRRVRASLVDGAWSVKGQIHVNSREKTLRLRPQVTLAVESGSGILLDWQNLVLTRGKADVSDGAFVTQPGKTRSLEFEGLSIADALGIEAARCRARLELRIQVVEAGS